jgi:hypothetical protein
LRNMAGSSEQRWCSVQRAACSVQRADTKNMRGRGPVQRARSEGAGKERQPAQKMRSDEAAASSQCGGCRSTKSCPVEPSRARLRFPEPAACSTPRFCRDVSRTVPRLGGPASNLLPSPHLTLLTLAFAWRLTRYYCRVLYSPCVYLEEQPQAALRVPTIYRSRHIAMSKHDVGTCIYTASRGTCCCS